MAHTCSAASVSHDSTGQMEYITASITFSGSYVQVAGAGEVFDPSTEPGLSQWYKSAPKLPIYVSFIGTNGYGVDFIPGTTLAGGKIKFSTAAATELGAGAYPAGVTGNTSMIVEVACRKA